jgi:mRNA interferase RelE/StbE
MASIEWSRRAQKDYDGLDRNVRERVRKTIERLAEGDGDVRRLTGHSPPLFRLRVGDWRVLFRHEAGSIVILRVLPRDKAYASR